MIPQALPANTLLREDGSYKIVSVLGHGGFGITYKAIDSNIDRLVAIKEFYPFNYCKREGANVTKTPGYTGIFNFDEYRDKFFDEAQRLGRFKHDNIVKILDAFKVNNTAYFVMEYEDGETLQEILSKKLYISETETIRYVTKIGQALEYIHNKDTLHRDVKPSNIIIRKNGEPVLLDFGAAREIVDSFDEHTAILSHGFAPPEQYIKTGKKGRFIDVYGLSATCYYCLTGSIPLRADHRTDKKLPAPIEINPQISSHLSDIILKGMEINTDDRFESISKFLYALTSLTIVSNFEVNLTKSQSEAITIIDQLIKDSETNALIINGMLHSGKTTLIKKLIAMNTNPLLTFKVLSIGSRISEQLTNRSGLEVSSMYGYIYDFSNNDTETDNSDIDLEQTEIKDSDIKRVRYNIKSNDDRINMVYIVDESQLLSDSLSENELYVFGSGKLLKDFIQFVNLTGHPTRKIIFVGDDKRILRGSKEESSLSKNHLENTYNLKVKSYELKEVIYTESKRHILNSAESIARSIGNNRFNHLRIEDDNSSIIKIDKNNFSEKFSNVDSLFQTVCITYSNRQAFNVNNYVRKSIFKKEGVIDKGDILIFNNTISLKNQNSDTAFPSFIHKGEIGEVLEVGRQEIITQNLKGKSPIKLTFISVLFFFPRLQRKEYVNVFENYLISEKDISIEERISLQIKARDNFKKITGKVKANRSAFSKYLREDKYYNSAFVKYAYAMTCHRASGLKWKYVFINCDTEKGKENEEYFRWFYSALGSVQNSSYLINYTPITPIYKLEWKDSVTGLDESFKLDQGIFSGNLNIVIPPELEPEALKLKFPNDKPALKVFWFLCHQKLIKHGISITNIEHHNYQEFYSFKRDSYLVKIRFYYNGNFKITRHQAIPKNTFSEEIISIISSNEIDTKTFDNFPEPFLKDFYLWAKDQFNKEGVSIEDVTHHAFHEIYLLTKSSMLLQIVIHYNSEGFFTTMMPTRFNSIDLCTLVKSIIQNKIAEVYA